VSNYLPVVVAAVAVVAAVTLTRRNRQRAAGMQAQQREKIAFGSEVMTTSGLYGTVVAFNEDDTVTLAIAPGVEVKWAIAAIREVSTLPPPYRAGNGPPEENPPEAADS
jgi:preprotein translocase subunit YajC